VGADVRAEVRGRVRTGMRAGVRTPSRRVNRDTIDFDVDMGQPWFVEGCLADSTGGTDSGPIGIRRDLIDLATSLSSAYPTVSRNVGALRCPDACS